MIYDIYQTTICITYLSYSSLIYYIIYYIHYNVFDYLCDFFNYMHGCETMREHIYLIKIRGK